VDNIAKQVQTEYTEYLRFLLTCNIAMYHYIAYEISQDKRTHVSTPTPAMDSRMVIHCTTIHGTRRYLSLWGGDGKVSSVK